jgi:NB-ARC domain
VTPYGSIAYRPSAIAHAVAEPQGSLGHGIEVGAAGPSATPDPEASQAPKSRTVALPMMSTHHFTGRQDSLDAVARVLGTRQGTRPGEVAIFGMPGVGKTQLSLQYAQHCTTKRSAGPKYSHCIFLQANDKARVQSEVRRAVLALGLVRDAMTNSMDYSWMVERFRGWLRETEDWLLIFDNVGNNNDLLSVRPQEGRGHIIYTTRNKNTAEILCGRDNIRELLPMSHDEGIALVRSWLGPSYHQHADFEMDVAQVADFAGGLPLTMEQIAQYATREGLTLEETLRVMRSKEQLLGQTVIDSFHEHNLATGAILIASFEAMERKSAMAGVLFRLLSYLEPSSISISMLQDGAREMEAYLSRDDTYDRGMIRTPEAAEHYRKWARRPKFDLLDYDGPLDLKLYLRLLRIGEYKRYRQPRLPRVDSYSDIAMQEFWQADSKLRTLFSNQNHLNATITEVQSSGLVRKVDNDTLWIHDLFAELMTVYTAPGEAQKLSEIRAHSAATLVWLAFPNSVKLMEMLEKPTKYLPHAEACLRHLKDHGDLLIDATIGAELSHVVASILCSRGGVVHKNLSSRVFSEQEKADRILSLMHYKNALRGYIVAHKRLMSHPAVRGRKGMGKVASAIRLEMDAEKECQPLGKARRFYTASRWTSDHERFGNNATWRCLQTALKIGLVSKDLDQAAEAERYMRMVKDAADLIWQTDPNGDERTEIDYCLVAVLEENNDWEGSLVVLMDKKRRLEKILAEDVGRPVDLTEVRDFWPATELAASLASCLLKLQRWEEGLRWLRIVLRDAREAHGRHGVGTWGPIMNLVRAHEAMGDWNSCLQWWLEALPAIFLHDTRDATHRMVDLTTEYPRAKYNCEQNGGIPEELKQQVEHADRAVEFCRETLEHKRRVDEWGEFLYTDEMLEEMAEESRKWYRRGMETGEL